MMPEPIMPDPGTIQDPPEVQEAYKQPVAPVEPNPTAQAPTNDDGSQPSGETPPASPPVQPGSETPPASGGDQQFTELVEGWKEDRARLDTLAAENLELKDKLSKVRQPEEDEEFEGLTEREKVDRIIAKRDEEAKANEEKEKAEVEGEIRFYERTDPFFRDHKKEVIQVAADFNAKNLSQAIMILKNQYTAAGKATGNAQYDDKRKKDAAGLGGGNAGGRPAIRPYDPKTDGNKSYGDLYREGGMS